MATTKKAVEVDVAGVEFKTVKKEDIVDFLSNLSAEAQEEPRFDEMVSYLACKSNTVLQLRKQFNRLYNPAYQDKTSPIDKKIEALKKLRNVTPVQLESENSKKNKE